MGSAGREQEIEAREKAATAGPWETLLVTKTETQLQATLVCGVVESRWPSGGGRTLAEIGHWRDRVDPEADAVFIAHARSDIPYLLAQLKEAREKLEAVEKLPLRHDKLPHATGGGCMSRCLACRRDRILKGGD